MSFVSPYRILGERPATIEQTAHRALAPSPALAERDAEIESVACEYDAPPDPEPPRATRTVGRIAMGCLMAASMMLMVWLASWTGP